MDQNLSKKTYRKDWNDCQNLKFLVSFMQETGLSISKAAAVLGLSRQSVYHWLVKDDARLSQVLELCKRCGFILSMELVRTIRTQDSFITIEVPHKKRDRRLSFFLEALSRYRITKEELSESLGVGVSTVYYWIKEDDCFVSYIFTTARLYGLNVRIDIRPDPNHVEE